MAMIISFFCVSLINLMKCTITLQLNVYYFYLNMFNTYISFVQFHMYLNLVALIYQIMSYFLKSGRNNREMGELLESDIYIFAIKGVGVVFTSIIESVSLSFYVKRAP